MILLNLICYHRPAAAPADRTRRQQACARTRQQTAVAGKRQTAAGACARGSRQAGSACSAPVDRAAVGSTRAGLGFLSGAP